MFPPPPLDAGKERRHSGSMKWRKKKLAPMVFVMSSDSFLLGHNAEYTWE